MKPFIGLLLLSILSACGVPSKPPTVKLPKFQALGLVHVTLDLSDEANPTGFARFTPLAQASPTGVGVQVISGINADIRLKRRAVSFLDDNESFGTKTRYIRATFDVSSVGTAFNNLNLLATSFASGPFQTRVGSTFINVVDGTGAVMPDSATYPDGSNVYRGLKPIQAVRPNASGQSGLETDPNHADLQLYTPTESGTVETNLSGAFPGADVLEYGFVVRNDAGLRSIPSTSGACSFDTNESCYTGQFTLAYKFPRNTTRQNNPFLLNLVFLVANETSEIASETLDDQSDPRGISRAHTLINKLPGAVGTLNVLPGSGAFDYVGTNSVDARTICDDLRTAAPSGAFVNPEIMTLAPGLTSFGGGAVAPNVFNLVTTSALNANFCDAMNVPTNNSFVVHGSISGLHNSANGTYGSFSGGLQLRYTPTVPYEVGETIQISLTGQTSRISDSASLVPAVYQIGIKPTATGVNKAFTALTATAAGDFPNAIAVGDFNEDGNLDIAVANTSSDNLSIKLGNGLGAFANAAGSPIAAGNSPEDVVVGDIDRDGNLDLLVASRLSSEVIVFKGNGLGGFANSGAVAVSSARRIGLGDFDGDGDLDLAAGTFAGNTSEARVYLNGGTGIFSSSDTVSFPGNTTGLEVADMNGDGKQDVIVTNSLSEIYVLLGDGKGNLVPSVTAPYASGNVGADMAVGDMDGDRRMDVVTVGRNSETVSSTIASGMFGDGGGDFRNTRPDVLSNQGDDAVVLADIDGDNDPDLVMGDDTANSDRVMVYLNDGTGTFAFDAFYALTAVAALKDIAVGDFNNDGKLDFVTANSNTDDVSVFTKN